MRLVILETPYAGNVTLNLRFIIACVHDALLRGEAPFASHLLYTSALNDNVLEQRTLGIQAGLAWGSKADATVVYDNLGISPGMKLGIQAAIDLGRPVEYRTLATWVLP